MATPPSHLTQIEVHVLCGQRDDSLALFHFLLQVIWGEAVPGGIAFIEDERGAYAFGVNSGSAQASSGEGNVKFHDPIIIENHAFCIEG